jgi:hypothetical protein
VNGGIGNDSRGTIATTEVRYRPGDEAKAQLVATHLAAATLVADASLPGAEIVLVLGKNFKGVVALPAAPAPQATATTQSPADACE